MCLPQKMYINVISMYRVKIILAISRNIKLGFKPLELKSSISDRMIPNKIQSTYTIMQLASIICNRLLGIKSICSFVSKIVSFAKFDALFISIINAITSELKLNNRLFSLSLGVSLKMERITIKLIMINNKVRIKTLSLLSSYFNKFFISSPQ
ncbi:hypothetical protein AN2V17_18590 [Vallitalea sp. AN17-2]|uniref:Uncharacterized protein n=1 Tax=Vallitalea maricola TaxID=3074433 RepID=A0ACB5UIE4_9FIRM|nr:hypothetical protein AN2V17_18590 [Vallitalea sp. AN17-2]